MSSIQFKCKEPGCKQYLEYEPQTVPIVMALKHELEKFSFSETTAEVFESAVKKLQANHIIKETKKVQLECEEGHNHFYTVPK